MASLASSALPLALKALQTHLDLDSHLENESHPHSHHYNPRHNDQRKAQTEPKSELEVARKNQFAAAAVPGG